MKILYVSTISNTMGFFTSHIKMLIEQGHTVDMACNIKKPIKPELLDLGCKVYNLEFQRAPFDKRNYIALNKLKKLILEEKYDIVHTHTPVASTCARLACRGFKNVKVLYTAHGFHFFRGAPLKNWLLYYPIEWWLSKYTDVLITINMEDYERAKTFFKAKKVEYIPGVGIDTNRFNMVDVDRMAKRKEIGVPENAFVLLSAGELNKNKNHETIINAIAKLKKLDVYFVICGQGSLENYLFNLIKKLELEKHVKLLGYRKDIAEIYKAADLFVLPSRREGLGLVGLEAMASGLPLITSNVHGIVDYSVDGKTGFTCAPDDVDGFVEKIEKLKEDAELRKLIGSYNTQAVKKFDITNTLNALQNIYSSLLK